jgi:hypothetical protein
MHKFLFSFHPSTYRSLITIYHGCQHKSQICTVPNLLCLAQLGTAPLLLLTNEWQLTSSSQGLFRGTRRWLKGQALELGADEPTILICLLIAEMFKSYEVQVYYIFLFLMNHWFKNIVFLMLSRNLSGKLTMQFIHEQCALTSRKQNNTMTLASIKLLQLS